jgi:hypothetical protein
MPASEPEQQAKFNLAAWGYCTTPGFSSRRLCIHLMPSSSLDTRRSHDEHRRCWQATAQRRVPLGATAVVAAPAG